ncbi:hypothetical protein L596_030771 [Steinernema carpocapsae]|uniref:Translocon-associated protein subunit gamma n=1 Tax=Steinernema carpocapsae TaxID=34508 RepID=A0A4U5LNQ6_STECR|nr:hypothetical protein L596_030771 [Steinernema carpocapsae]
MVKATKITKEDELLLQSFSSSAAINSTSTSALFFVMATCAVLPLLYLFYGINQMDIYESGIILGVSAIAGIYSLIFSYKQMTQNQKPKIERLRQEAIARDICRELADDKKISKKEKDDRVLFKVNEHAAKESAAWAIFYNNALFTAVCLFFAFFVFGSLSGNINCVVSIVGAGGVVALFSTSK